jgi:hypothetical protein
MLILSAQRERLAQTILWTSSTEVKYMSRTAIACGSASAHNLAAYSQSELGFATNFNMYSEVQLPPPNGSLDHTRGPMNCAMPRSKALINAMMPVYFVSYKKSYISHGTAKSVGSHSVSNTRCHISVDDCAKTENLCSLFEAVPARCVLGPRTASNRLYRGPVSLTIGDQNAIKSCRWSSDFYLPPVVRPLHDRRRTSIRWRSADYTEGGVEAEAEAEADS